VESDFLPIEDASIVTMVDKWASIAFEAFCQQRFKPEDRVTTTPVILVELESNVWNKSDATCRNGMLVAYPEAELSILQQAQIYDIRTALAR
jgi:hypothetical protein